MPNKLVLSAGLSIAYNVIVQISCRMLTFVLNAVTLRYIPSNAILGIINVRLALLYTTLQFLSKEPFRRACIGYLAKQSSINSKVINTIWLGPIFSLIISAFLAKLWHYTAPSSDDLSNSSLDDYSKAVIILCVSVIIETLSESNYIYAQAKALVSHNPLTELFSTSLKCTLVAFSTIKDSKSGDNSSILTNIAYCHLIASILGVIFSFVHISWIEKIDFRTMIPKLRRQNNNENYFKNNFDYSSVSMSLYFFSQTILKQFLTEGERYVMTFFDVIPLAEQGIFDVVNSLASLPARLIFRPIELSCFTLFSQITNRKKILDERKFHEVQFNLITIIKVMILGGLVIALFGYNYAHIIIIYNRDKLNNSMAFYLMRWQLIYIPLLALNGITECFTSAVMDAKDIRKNNYYFIMFSGIFLASIYATSKYLSSASFIFANCLNMILRIVLSVRHISIFFKNQGHTFSFHQLMPSPSTIACMVSCFLALSSVVTQPDSDDLITTRIILDIAKGVPFLVVVLYIIYRSEKDVVNNLRNLFRQKNNVKKSSRTNVSL